MAKVEKVTKEEKMKLYEKLQEYFIEDEDGEDKVEKIVVEKNHYLVIGKIHYQDVRLKFDRKTLEEIDD